MKNKQMTNPLRAKVSYFVTSRRSPPEALLAAKGDFSPVGGLITPRLLIPRTIRPSI